MYSQTTNIVLTPQQKQKIEQLFTPENIIEYSKGLSNEQKLKEYVVQLESALHEKDSLAQDLFDRLVELQNIEELLLQKQYISVNKILSLTNQLKEANQRIREIDGEVAGVNKKTSNSGLYLSVEYGSTFKTPSDDILDYKHAFFGLEFVKSNMIYGVKVNPVNSRLIYAGSISIKIF